MEVGIVKVSHGRTVQELFNEIIPEATFLFFKKHKICIASSIPTYETKYFITEDRTLTQEVE